MSCAITSNLSVTCADETANGGLSRIFMVADKQVASVTFGVSPAHTITGITTVDSAKFVEYMGRFETKSISTEANKDNGGVRYTHTIELFIPKLNKTKAEVLAQLDAVRGTVAIVETYESAGTDKQALVFGYDKKIGGDAFLKGTTAQMLEATVNGQNGYMLTLVGAGTELTREFIGTITVEDGATGTSVSFGA